MTDIYAQLQQVFAEGLHEAGENYREGGIVEVKRKMRAETRSSIRYQVNQTAQRHLEEQNAGMDADMADCR